MQNVQLAPTPPRYTASLNGPDIAPLQGIQGQRLQCTQGDLMNQPKHSGSLCWEIVASQEGMMPLA